MRGLISLPRTLWTAALLGPAALLISAAPAQASLRILDTPRHAALWQRIYDHLPTLWKTDQPVRVEELPIEELNANQDEADSRDVNDEESDNHNRELADGEFIEDDDSDAPPTIRLANSLNDEHSGLVFAHEYGHFVWNDKLTRAQRRAYRHLWWRQMRAGHLVTDYASDSTEEGFAEAFSYFLQKPDQLKRKDIESYRFLTQAENDDPSGGR